MPQVELNDPADRWLSDVTDDQLSTLIAQVQRRRAEIDARLGFLLAVQQLRATRNVTATPPPGPVAPTTP